MVVLMGATIAAAAFTGKGRRLRASCGVWSVEWGKQCVCCQRQATKRCARIGQPGQSERGAASLSLLMECVGKKEALG